MELGTMVLCQMVALFERAYKTEVEVAGMIDAKCYVEAGAALGIIAALCEATADTARIVQAHVINLAWEQQQELHRKKI